MMKKSHIFGYPLGLFVFVIGIPALIWEEYAEDFISGRLVYQRFSPHEQHGCAAGGTTNVIASLLAGAENCADTNAEETLSEFERERQQTEQREPSSLLEWPSRDG